MIEFKTKKRREKIISVLSARQKNLKLVLENIHDPHNVSAIFRTCDAVGIQYVNLLYNTNKFPKIGKKSSASAFKWVDRTKFVSVSECFRSLRNEGFKIYASSLKENSKNLYDLDLTGKIAIVLGNEHTGISEEVEQQSDLLFKIPMFGMVQSLNVSVAAAVILYETLRQRLAKGMYRKSEFSEDELKTLIDIWSDK